MRMDIYFTSIISAPFYRQNVLEMYGQENEMYK